MVRTKSTPCVGICSTTYGDLVCRGCKRFAHEIVAWNGYAAEQKAHIWKRLHGLRDQVVTQLLRVQDTAQLEAYCQAAGLPVTAEPANVHQVLGHLVARGGMLSEAGLVCSESQHDVAALEVLQRLDAEVFSRSVAHYERNFRVTS
ncbi:MAG: DUF1289 domain-containing protein [Pseudomonadales bacterium]